jgi:CBS-domain-containing membrane protein
MKVEQIMTKRVATCTPGDTLNEAARIMWEHDCGVVPIIEDGLTRRVVGIVTDRDACMAAYTRGQPLSGIRVGEVMCTDVASCRGSEDVHEAEQTMQRAQVHRLPVVDDADQLLGIISLADIARETSRGIGSRRQEVTATELGETIKAIRKPREIADDSAP